jgi:hypothetical protein
LLLEKGWRCFRTPFPFLQLLTFPPSLSLSASLYCLQHRLSIRAVFHYCHKVIFLFLNLALSNFKHRVSVDLITLSRSERTRCKE